MSTSPSPSDPILDTAAALALGALPPDEAAGAYQQVENATPSVQHEYQTMLWAAQWLPAFVPMVEPPPALKQSLLQQIRQDSATVQPAAHEHHHPSEFIPFLGKKGEEFYSITAEETDWLSHPVKGIAVKPLATDSERGYATFLMKLDAGTIFPTHSHSGAEQCYVVSGAVEVRGENLPAGSFFSTQTHGDHGEIRSETGATVLLVVALEDYRKSAWKIGVKIGTKALKTGLTRLFASKKNS